MSPVKPVTVVVKTRRGILALLLLVVVCAPFAGWFIGARVNHQCESIHRIVQAGVDILDSPKNLREALNRGEITRLEYTSSLTQIHRFDPLRERNLKVWRSADCIR